MKWIALLKFAPRILGATKEIKTKGWYSSRTILTNIIVLAGDIAQAMGYIPGVELGQAESIAVAIVAVGNIYLRAVTTAPVGKRTEKGITDDAPATRAIFGAPVERLPITPVDLPPIELQARPESGTQPSGATDPGFQNR